MEYVLIKSGTYQKLQIADKVFPVVKQFKSGARGSYITVDGTTLGSDYARPVRIKCAVTDIVAVEQDAYDRQLGALDVNSDIKVGGEKVYTAEEDGEVLDILVTGVGTYTGVAVSQGCPNG